MIDNLFKKVSDTEDEGIMRYQNIGHVRLNHHSCAFIGSPIFRQFSSQIVYIKGLFSLMISSTAGNSCSISILVLRIENQIT